MITTCWNDWNNLINRHTARATRISGYADEQLYTRRDHISKLSGEQARALNAIDYGGPFGMNRLAPGGYYPGQTDGTRLALVEGDVPGTATWERVPANYMSEDTTMRIGIIGSASAELLGMAAGAAVLKGGISNPRPITKRSVTIERPTLYKNVYPDDTISSPLQTFTPAQLSRKSGRFNYVVNEAGDLAGGAVVRAAGEVRFVHGKIRHIDNFSGHYQPFGRSAQSQAIKAFKSNGFKLSREQYLAKF